MEVSPIGQSFNHRPNSVGACANDILGFHPRYNDHISSGLGNTNTVKPSYPACYWLHWFPLHICSTLCPLCPVTTRLFCRATHWWSSHLVSIGGRCRNLISNFIRCIDSAIAVATYPQDSTSWLGGTFAHAAHNHQEPDNPLLWKSLPPILVHPSVLPKFNPVGLLQKVLKSKNGLILRMLKVDYIDKNFKYRQ